MKTVQLAIIGGGPAGLAAAAAAYDAGLRDILILERSGELGGILNQCIHAGFGLHTFHQELTGPEYAQRYIDAVQERGIPAWTDCMVLDVSPEKVLTVTGRSAVGLQQIRAQAVVLAMGCRERPRGALNSAGTRPAGIWSAGTAQRMVNMEGYLPGRQVVILGSGDIGLIMARRMTLEGAEGKAVAEVMPYSGGLKRNIVQCLDDFDIPLYLSTTVVEIHGQEHLTGVTLAQVDDRRLPVAGTERYIPCDTLLLSVGLLPENELTRQAGAALDAVTGGPAVDETLATSLPGVCACGNVLHVHDLVDCVSLEAAAAGRSAARYVLEGGEDSESIRLEGKNGVRYTVPQPLHRGGAPVTVRFRVGQPYRNAALCAYAGSTLLKRIPKRILTPGEMESFPLDPAAITAGATGTGGSTKWADKTTVQIYNDVLALFAQLSEQSSGLIDKDTPLKFCLSPELAVRLGAATDFNVSVLDMLKRYFTRIDIVTVPELHSMTAGETMFLIAPEVNGQRTGTLAFGEKMRAGRVVPDLSSFRQKFVGTTYGGIVLMPFAFAQMTGA